MRSSTTMPCVIISLVIACLSMPSASDAFKFREKSKIIKIPPKNASVMQVPSPKPKGYGSWADIFKQDKSFLLHPLETKSLQIVAKLSQFKLRASVTGASQSHWVDVAFFDVILSASGDSVDYPHTTAYLQAGLSPGGEVAKVYFNKSKHFFVGGSDSYMLVLVYNAYSCNPEFKWKTYAGKDITWYNKEVMMISPNAAEMGEGEFGNYHVWMSKPFKIDFDYEDTGASFHLYNKNNCGYTRIHAIYDLKVIK